MEKIHEKYPEDEIERGGGGASFSPEETEEMKQEIGEISGVDASALGSEDFEVYEKLLSGKLDFGDLEAYKMKIYNDVLDKEKKGEPVNIFDEPKGKFFNWIIENWSKQQESAGEVEKRDSAA